MAEHCWIIIALLHPTAESFSLSWNIIWCKTLKSLDYISVVKGYKTNQAELVILRYFIPLWSEAKLQVWPLVSSGGQSYRQHKCVACSSLVSKHVHAAFLANINMSGRIGGTIVTTNAAVTLALTISTAWAGAAVLAVPACSLLAVTSNNHNMDQRGAENY